MPKTLVFRCEACGHQANIHRVVQGQHDPQGRPAYRGTWYLGECPFCQSAVRIAVPEMLWRELRDLLKDVPEAVKKES